MIYSLSKTEMFNVECSMLNVKFIHNSTFNIEHSSLLRRAPPAAALLLAGIETVDLQKVELDRRRPAEDRDHDLQRVAVEVHFLDHAGEVRERAVDDPDVLAVLVDVL